jgi:hypothetical protein
MGFLNEMDWKTLEFNMLLPQPVPYHQKISGDQSLDVWLKARDSDHNMHRACEAWFKGPLKKPLWLSQPFMSEWTPCCDKGSPVEKIAVSCMKWETICLLCVTIMENIEHRPISGDKLLQAIAFAEKAKKELLQWENLDSWDAADAHGNKRTPYELDEKFFHTLKKIAECMYHVTRFLLLEEKHGDRGLL